MNDGKTKFVDFDKYCKTCKHQKLKEEQPPCDECLEYATNEYSHRPVKWEAK